MSASAFRVGVQGTLCALLWLVLSLHSVHAEETSSTPGGTVRIHFHRENNDYLGWGLYVWGAGLNLPRSVTWDRSLEPSGVDSFGVYFDVGVGATTSTFSLILHKGEEKSWQQDMAVDIVRDGREVWIFENSGQVHARQPKVFTAFELGAEAERQRARQWQLAAAVVGLTLIALLLLARWMRARHQRTRSDLAEHVKLLLQAQTELREQSVRWQGTSSDELTGLPIRAGLNQALEQALGRAEREQLAVAVFFIDLDGFKAVNDSAGHDVGDAVLREVAKRLCKGLRHSDVVARLGGDEFVAVVEGPKSVIQAYRLGRKLIQRVSEPVAVNGQDHQVGASIGLALFPDDAADAAGLLKAADQAMYSAKRAGKGQCQLSSAAHQATVSAHLAMEASLREAIGCGAVSLRRSLWQTLAEEQAVGQEVAPHWQHEGRWQPVIPVLTLTDDAELMTQFDRWQLRQAVRTALESPGVPGADGAWMMVPLASAAAAGVALDEWPDRVRDVLAEEGLPPQRLVLQLPARWLCDEHRSLDALTRLRARGVRIAFLGVGEREVPLRRLIEAPVDWLIVDAAAAAQLSSALVRALAAVGAQCGFQLAAQGLDSPERRRWAGAAGCVIGSLTAVESP